MTEAATTRPVALISGVGPGLGTSLCRRFHREGYAVAALARSRDHRETLEAALGDNGTTFRLEVCDVGDEAAVRAAVARIAEAWSAPSVLVHNAGGLVIEPFAQTTAAAFEALWRVTALGGFHLTQAVVPAMAARGAGTIVVTGATASLRGGARFSALASAKFALRGLAQSLAREYGPQGIHVVHAVLDGVMWGGISRDLVTVPREKAIEPDAVAEAYVQLVGQHRSAWTQELDLRPAGESF